MSRICKERECDYPNCERTDTDLVYADWGLWGCPEHREYMVDDLLAAQHDQEIMEVIERKYNKHNK